MLLKAITKPPIMKQILILSLKKTSSLIKKPINDENSSIKADIEKADGSKNNPI